MRNCPSKGGKTTKTIRKKTEKSGVQGWPLETLVKAVAKWSNSAPLSSDLEADDGNLV